MAEPISLFTLAVGALIKSTPHWMHALEGTAQSKGKELAISQGKKLFDRKQYEKHMSSALENAVTKGIVQFQTLAERDQYSAVIQFLAEPGPNNQAMRNEALKLLTLSDTPDFSKLTEKYNLRERISSFAQHTDYKDINATPYLSCFFTHFRDELFADDLFKQQISNILMVRSTMSMQQSLTDIAATLPSISDAVTHRYSDDQFTQDVQNYIAYIERSLRYLKVIGIIPKDQNGDPELAGIFVPLRTNLHTKEVTIEKDENNSIIAILERHPKLVLLGGPGSGKSTATKYLAWSHASARFSGTPSSSSSLLPGKPVPLRIELRRLNDDRRNNPDYTFLSYTEALLRREGIEVNSQMFKRLLTNKNMLLLFDGLDEAATLNERKQLVEEIEGFTSCYPGNYVIVTSRPVGYDLARLSSQLFNHATVQDFDDTQIHQFLERWYTYMLRLSPITQNDQQELEELFKALKENQRLHKLAENPLLLTVITPLHRYERLPDKRVQVYDRCADILLETWAKLRGTKARWRDIQMAKDDQYACVAYLGFVLHKRSQEDIEDAPEETASLSTWLGDRATDVPTRFILKEIKRFLADRNLISEVKVQNLEAERFLELMQMEAGLIVERGTNQYNENLYGFVHRTFQEYFAAADIYERYQQEVDPTILSDFLSEHLHDPHWHEVILLLLGKLKRKPVTALLRQILEGKIKSRRSQFVEILQQDLFFICVCLSDEIVVEIDLAQTIISNLIKLIQTSPFQSQRNLAEANLRRLIHTRQYSRHAEDAVAMLNFEDLLNVETKIDIAKTIYHISLSESNSKQRAFYVLLNIAQNANLSFEQRFKAANALIHPKYRFRGNKTLFLADEMSTEPKDTQQAMFILISWIQDANLSIEQRIRAASTIYSRERFDSEEGRQAAHILLSWIQDVKLPGEQRIQAARVFSNNPIGREEDHRASHILLKLGNDPKLAIDQRILAAQSVYYSNSSNLKERQQAAHILLSWVQDTNLPIKQRIQASTIFPRERFDSEEGQQAAHILLSWVQDVKLPVEQRIQAAHTLYRHRGTKLTETEQAGNFLLNLAQDVNLSVGQRIRAANALSDHYFALGLDSKLRLYQQAKQILLNFMLNEGITIDQRLQAAERFISAGSTSVNTVDSERVQAMQIVFDLLNKDAIKHYFEKHWHHSPHYLPEELDGNDLLQIFKLVQQDSLPLYVRNNIYEVLAEMTPQFDQIPTVS